MLEAITGVPAAKASVRTMPKLSPESEGAQSTSASCKRPPDLIVRDPAAGVDVLGQLGVGEVAIDASSRSAPITVSRQGTCSIRPPEGGEQHRQALALLGAADEEDPQLLAGGFGPAGAASMSTPLGTIAYSPPNQRRPVQAAASETAIRAESLLKPRRAPGRVAMWFGIALVE